MRLPRCRGGRIIRKRPAQARIKPIFLRLAQLVAQLIGKLVGEQARTPGFQLRPALSGQLRVVGQAGRQARSQLRVFAIYVQNLRLDEGQADSGARKMAGRLRAKL